VSFTKLCTAGIGYFFECAWADAALAAGAFLFVLLLGELVVYACGGSNACRRLSVSDKRELTIEISKFVLSIVSLYGSLYILFTNNWYLDHPRSPNTVAYPRSLDFFLPWMVGYNVGCIFHIILCVLRRDVDVVLPDVTPHALHIILYTTLLESKALGMLATFQIVLESHHFLRAPVAILEMMTLKETMFYKILDWTLTLFRPVFLYFSGPYSVAILIYHSNLMREYSWLVWLVIWGQITVNLVFLLIEMWWWGYKVHCWFKKKRSRRDEKVIPATD